MTDARFTRGPWTVQKNEYGDLVIRPDGVCVASVGRGPFGEPAIANFGHEQGPDVDADARLIAAAPDLYEALEGLRAEIVASEEHGEGAADTGCPVCQAIEKADQALAKAADLTRSSDVGEG